MRLFQEGVPRSKIEKVMLKFGMPLSPFLLADEVGNDVGYKASKTFEQAYGPRMAVPSILTVLYEMKLFGKKSSKGFYLYKNGKPTGPNPELEKINQKYKNNKIDEIEIRDRVILSMINEAARCLEEKVIENRELDMALIMGIGFPPFRGGLAALC